MNTKANNYKATGIANKNVSWAQDVLPLLNKLQGQGLAMDVSRDAFHHTGGSTYMYDMLVDIDGVSKDDIEKRLYCRTNSLAAVWMYLKGIENGQGMGSAEKGTLIDGLLDENGELNRRLEEANRAIKALYEEHHARTELARRNLDPALVQAVTDALNGLTTPVQPCADVDTSFEDGMTTEHELEEERTRNLNLQMEIEALEAERMKLQSKLLSIRHTAQIDF
jgi:hypothetical protein